MKKLLCFTIIFLLMISSSTIGFSEVLKDETVYVKLNHDGSTDSIVVVNHLSGTSSDEYFVDYGDYSDIETLVTDVEPTIEDGIVKWPIEVLKEKDIYYQGRVDNELPMKIDIRYYLNDNEIKAEELLGESGKVKIKVSISESKDFTTQIQIPLSLSHFSNIKTEDGVAALVGKTMTVAFNHLPMGDQEFVVEADGKDIELQSFIISSTIMDLQLPGDIDSDLDKLSSGIGDISEANTELSEGSTELSKGSSKLKNGLKSLASGISQLFGGMKDIDSNTKEVVKGFGEFNLGLLSLKENLIGLTSGVNDINNGLINLKDQGSNIKDGLVQLNESTKELNGGLSNINNGLGELNTGHQQLSLLAQSLQNHEDPSVKALAEGVIAETNAISSISENTGKISGGLNQISNNLNKTAVGYGEYNKGLVALATGFAQFNEGIKPLSSGIDAMYDGHIELTNGLDALSNGISSTTNGLKSLNSQTSNLPNEVQKIVNGQDKITDGLNRLNEEGLKEIKTSIEDFNTMGLDTSKSDYTSFVNKKNENTKTGFVMNTPAVTKGSIENTDKPFENTITKKSVFERFLDLFKK